MVLSAEKRVFVIKHYQYGSIKNVKNDFTLEFSDATVKVHSH